MVAKRKKPKQENLQPKKVRKSLLIILVIAAGLLSITVFGNYSGWSKDSALEKEIANKRSKALISADAKTQKNINLLKQQGIINEQISMTIKDICMIMHDDAGMLAYKYHQVCYIRYVFNYSTNIDKDTTLGNLKTLSNSEKEELGLKVVEKIDPPQSCLLNDSNSSSSFVYIGTGVTRNSYYNCVPVNTVVEKGRVSKTSEVTVKHEQQITDKNKASVWFNYDAGYHDDLEKCERDQWSCNSKPAITHPRL